MSKLDAYFKVSPPDEGDVKRVFGEAAQGRGANVVRLNLVLDEFVAGHGTAAEKQQQIRQFFNANAGDIAQAFESAKVLTFDGLPSAQRGKIYEEVGVWVREEDAAEAHYALFMQNWVSRVERGQPHSIGAPIHR